MEITDVYVAIGRGARRLLKAGNGTYPFRNATAGSAHFHPWRGKKPTEAKNQRDTATRIQRMWARAEAEKAEKEMLRALAG